MNSPFTPRSAVISMLTVVWASVALGLHGAVRPPRVVVRVAEADFVDHENLECGETCSLALKAFDASDNFLCAGALVRRRSSSLGYEVHDCWIADSIESGVGPNLQTRGAQLILDVLFLHHLEARTRGDDVVQFSVFAGDGTGCYAASHVAARSRGFVISLYDLMLTMGALTAAGVNALLQVQEVANWLDANLPANVVVAPWRIAFALPGLAALPYFLCSLFLPETPAFLAQRGQIEEALDLLRRLHGKAASASAASNAAFTSTSAATPTVQRLPSTAQLMPPHLSPSYQLPMPVRTPLRLDRSRARDRSRAQSRRRALRSRCRRCRRRRPRRPTVSTCYRPPHRPSYRPSRRPSRRPPRHPRRVHAVQV